MEDEIKRNDIDVNVLKIKQISPQYSAHCKNLKDSLAQWHLTI